MYWGGNFLFYEKQFNRIKIKNFKFSLNSTKYCFAKVLPSLFYLLLHLWNRTDPSILSSEKAWLQKGWVETSFIARELVKMNVEKSKWKRSFMNYANYELSNKMMLRKACITIPIWSLLSRWLFNLDLYNFRIKSCYLLFERS